MTPKKTSTKNTPENGNQFGENGFTDSERIERFLDLSLAERQSTVDLCAFLLTMGIGKRLGLVSGDYDAEGCREILSVAQRVGLSPRAPGVAEASLAALMELAPYSHTDESSVRFLDFTVCAKGFKPYEVQEFAPLFVLRMGEKTSAGTYCGDVKIYRSGIVLSFQGFCFWVDWEQFFLSFVKRFGGELSSHGST